MLALAVLAAGALTACRGGGSSTPSGGLAEVSSTTTLAADTPAMVVAQAPTPEGYVRVQLNPKAFKKLRVTHTTQGDDPTYAVRDEEPGFSFEIELHTKGPGWTGEMGAFATDCPANGICVRFDPDGQRGPAPVIVASPTGEINVQQLGSRVTLVLNNLIFVRTDGGPIYKIDEFAIDAPVSG